MTATSQGQGWSAAVENSAAVVALSGDWIARKGGVEPDAASHVLATGARALSFNTDQLGRWDSALIAFLSSLRDGGMVLDEAGLPATARQLLALASGSSAVPEPPQIGSIPERIGRWALSIRDEAGEAAALRGRCLCGQHGGRRRRP